MGERKQRDGEICLVVRRGFHILLSSSSSVRSARSIVCTYVDSTSPPASMCVQLSGFDGKERGGGEEGREGEATKK